MYEYSGIVQRVVDGDTVVLDLDLGFHVTASGVRVRLLAVFAPELKKNKRLPDAAGEAAKAELESLLPVGSAVRLDSKSLDKYGRSLGWLYFGDENVNKKMYDYLMEVSNVD